MKIRCDLCNGELMIDTNVDMAVCMHCGMYHSMARLKEKMNIFEQENHLFHLEDEQKDKLNHVFKKIKVLKHGFNINSVNRIVIDRNKLNQLIRLIDKYEHLDDVKIYPHPSFKNIFLDNEVLKLKEKEIIVRVENIRKQDMVQMFIDFKNILGDLELIELNEQSKISRDEDFVISTENDEEIEIGVISEYIGDASIIEIIKDVESIGRYQDGKPVFKYPEKVKEIHIGDNITTIGSHAFMGCSDLKEIVIPSNVEYLGYSLKHHELGFSHAFEGCIGLEKVTFGINAWNDYDSCKGLFKNCVNLKEVKLPNTISCIPESTFENCENLEEIIIPDRVCMIGANAFKGCKRLKRVYLPNHDMIIHPSAFENTLYTPPYKYVNEKVSKRCPVCGDKINLWKICKKCERVIIFT